MKPAPAKTGKRSFGEAPLMVLVLVVVMLPPLYVLSCGPLAWVADQTGGNWYDTLFAPLIWLYEHWPAMQPWLDRYIDLWTLSHICNGR